MAKKILEFVISYIHKGKVTSTIRTDFKEAYALYESSVKKYKLPSRLAARNDGNEVTLEAYAWDLSCYNKQKEDEWTKKVESLLANGTKLNKVQIATVTAMDHKQLRNAVVCRDVDKLCELKGIAEKSAIRVIRALKSICKPAKAPMGKSREFPRLMLMNRGEDIVAFDTIKKTVSPLEAMAMKLGGEDAVIHIVSQIEDGTDEESNIRAERMLDKWLELVNNGIKYNGELYKLFGHGTNAAKWCKSIAVKASIYDAMRNWSNAGCDPEWQNTVAKDVAYKVGLVSVYSHKVRIPFKPEMFCIYPTVETNWIGDTTKLFLDGHAEDRNNDTVSVKRSDGFFAISVAPKMKVTLFNEMVQRGQNPEEVEQILNEFCEDTKFYSYRGTADEEGNAPLKLKGLGAKNVDVQSYLKSIGVTKTPDGRDIDDIVFFVDETVIKTSVGKGKAYPTFEAWCKAMGEYVYVGTVVKTHPKEKKDVSYQVTQSICEATDEMVAKMGAKTVERLNGMHTMEGATKLLGREWGKVAKHLPSIVNERIFDEMIRRAMETETNEAFSGKILRDCYYAFVCPDVFPILTKWHGKEVSGMLKAGQVHIPGVRKGKLAMWRSPVMHPNSVRIVENVDIPAEYKKFIKDEFCILLNDYDDIPVAMDMDFDGDHGNISDDDAIIEAVEATLVKWNRLIIWETPTPNKGAIGEKELTEYWKGLVHMNELGLTVYGLNALLNGLILDKDPITGHWGTKRVLVSRRGIDFKKFAANVLVDASKHGGATIDEPEESAICSKMLQPWAKTYQDAVDAKKIWHVKYNGIKYFFETEEAAKSFYDNQRYEYIVNDDGIITDRIDRFEIDNGLKAKLAEPVNYLNELANPKVLNWNLRYKTLNKLFGYYADNARRDTVIDDRPTEAFDYHMLMFDSTEGRRGISGLVRKGNKEDPVFTLMNGEKICPAEGLFNSLARRLDRDRAEYMNDDSIKDKEGNSFEMTWRANALAEIEEFAAVYGKTLKDAYDVITWYMFVKCDEDFLQMNGKMDFLRNKLWQAYRIIFGGMAVEAVEEKFSNSVEE